MLCMGNVTQEQEDNPDSLGWLDQDAGINIDVLAMATYGMASNVLLLDRWLEPIHTDSDEVTTASWADTDSTTSATWQDQDATDSSSWTDADQTTSHTWN